MNIPEQNLLVLLLPKDSFDTYKDLVDLDYIIENYRELSYVYNILFSLHSSNPTNDISLDEVETSLYVKYPDADKVIYGALFKALKSLSIKPEVGRGILEDVRRRKVALKLSELSFRLAQGLDTPDKLQDYWNTEYVKVDHQEHGLSATTQDLEELIEQTYHKPGYRWRLDCLNKSLGSLRNGDFGFVFARPETGKTTFLASEVTRFLDGSEQPIVWFNNEEQGAKVMLRIYQAYFGVTKEQLLSNPKRFHSEFKARTAGRFHLFDSATIHRKEVERVVASTSPGVVIYDQIDKIKGFNNDREDLRLGSIYQWARELAKGSHAAIGVCQASGSGEGVRYLTMDHVANALTAKQAEADFIIGIGKSHDSTEENIRFLNISKNKLTGDADSIPNLRHGRFEVLLKAELARYEDITNYG